MSRFQHFSHEHPMLRVEWTADGFHCGMCNLADIPGEDSGYGCFECLFFINKACSILPQKIDRHPLHAQHPLTLANRSTKPETTCHYCDNSFEKDEYTYACHESCAFYMHMKCANIPLPTIKDAQKGEFLCHESSMALVDSGKGSCFACQGAVSGPAYRCCNKDCSNIFHQNCVDKLERKVEKHPFHTRHPLVLRVSKPRLCLSCCKRDCRLVFECEDCEFHLCVDCVFLDTRVRCRSHDHDLYIVNGASCDILCHACRKSHYKWPDREVPEEVRRTRSCQFRCVECDFNFHFLCGPLPEKVKCEYHVDVLSLVDHSVTKGHSNEYYCDVCEKEIEDTRFRVYYCEDCKYVAHIHCVFSEIMEMFKGNTTTQNMKLKSFGEERWEVVTIESTDKTNKNGDPKEFKTLRDIYESLTEEEKKKLADPFGFDRPSHRTNRQNRYKYYREQNSVRFDRKPSLFDNVNVIEKLLSLDSDIDIISEVWNYTPEESLVLQETYLRQQVEDVKGYKVPKTLVHILYTLLIKHGDLGGDRNLSLGLKSVGATLLCIVVENMCRIIAEEITLEDLKRWYFCLEAIRKITGFEVVKLESFEEFIFPTFLGLEATRLRHEVSESLDKKIEELKAELKRYEESREKLRKYETESTASRFMKECLRKASEWKMKAIGDKWF